MAGNLGFQKLDEFFSRFKKLTFKKGETILRAGDEPRGVFFLKKGYVRLYAISENAQELTLIIFKPEDFFPLIWAIHAKTPNEFYLEAMGHVELLQAPRAEFVNFIKKESDVLYELNSRILIRLGGLIERMVYMVFGNAYNKVASIIAICAQRFGYSYKNGIVIDVSLTHKDIADLLGIARETASIEIKKLEKKGIIGYLGRHILVRDLKVLKRELRFE